MDTTQVTNLNFWKLPGDWGSPATQDAEGNPNYPASLRGPKKADNHESGGFLLVNWSLAASLGGLERQRYAETMCSFEFENHRGQETVNPCLCSKLEYNLCASLKDRLSTSQNQ